MNDLKIGDICICNGAFLNTDGKMCKVISLTGGSTVLCEFFENVNGHDGGGLGKDNHCFWLNYRRLTPCSLHKRVNSQRQRMV